MHQTPLRHSFSRISVSQIFPRDLPIAALIAFDWHHFLLAVLLSFVAAKEAFLGPHRVVAADAVDSISEKI